MSRRVYIETSIPSFYFETRPEPAMVAMREWTRSWWSASQLRDDLVTGAAVIDELERGDFATRSECHSLMKDIRLVPVEPAILDIVETYVSRHVMPRDPTGDALHLALASYHRCDFLLTWNCRHLANANKFGHIRRVDALLGLYVPEIVTPFALLGGENET